MVKVKAFTFGVRLDGSGGGRGGGGEEAGSRPAEQGPGQGPQGKEGGCGASGRGGEEAPADQHLAGGAVVEDGRREARMGVGIRQGLGFWGARARSRRTFGKAYVNRPIR